MNYQHRNLASGRWRKLSFFEQMANIGSEVFRANSWKSKNISLANQAFERSLELFDLTIDDPKNLKRLKEILRAREVWVDYFYGDNEYQSSNELWNKYFYAFNYAARK